MFDHITIGVTDLARAMAFYDPALAALGMTRLIHAPAAGPDDVSLAGYGAGRPTFWLSGERPVSGLLHIAFRAPSQSAVAGFHAAALGAGGVDNGAPGLRPEYHPGYFACYVRDPDGHNVEAVCHDAPLPS